MPIDGQPAYEGIPMHEECSACHTRVQNLDPEQTLLAHIAFMIADSVEIEDVHRGLCFLHRREVDDVVRQMRAIK